MKPSFRIRGAIAAMTAAALALGASAAIASTQLIGAGSSFDFPFFQKAFYEYSQDHSNVTVNYQSIGSGGGINQFIAKTVDFGATDVPMNAAEVKRAGGTVLQIPITLGGAAMGYNIPGIPQGLKLTRALIADIYLGKVTKWNDPAIAKLNPEMKLPGMAITVVHRSDGSGTSYIFSDFLSHVSPEWKAKVGTGKSLQWPVGIGGKGNEGVAGAVSQTPGAIGYIELAYVLENQMTYAKVQNQAGDYVFPSIETVAAAAAEKPKVNAEDFSIVDQAGAESYPISGYSWVVLYQHPKDPARAKEVKRVMKWLVTKGQALAKSVDYVPLPPNVQHEALKVISEMKV
ncbi:MAG: phosphate ABC transporter substrate-binding protein PstS [Candidatus Binataceae bacterium]